MKGLAILMNAPFYNNHGMKSGQLFFMLATAWSVVLLCALSDARAQNQYLIDPTGGTVLFNSNTTNANEVITGQQLGFTGNFFGNPVTTVDVSTNGNLNFSGDANYFNQPMPDPNLVARISPLWNGLIINAGDGGSITSLQQLGVYYAVTWDNLETYPGSTGRQSFQAVWFGASTTIKGFSFLPDDIAFSYKTIGAPFLNNGNPGDPGNATVGLDAGDGTNFVPLPGTPDGLITDASLLPLTSNDQFLLFRPDGFGSYTASIQQFSLTGVPESGTLYIAAMGLILVGVALLIRRHNTLDGSSWRK